MNPKLHELLAVEGKLEGQSKKVVGDLTQTFHKKRHHFEEKTVVFTPNAEGERTVTEAQSDIQTTVDKELKWVTDHLTNSLDASYQVAETNTQARADIILTDGTIVAKNVPATALLELEKRVSEIADLLKNIPTLDPAKGFSPDTARGDGYFQAREVTKGRTKKVNKPIVLYDATENHPAQTQIVTEDVEVGKIQEQEWSSLFTPAKKSALINKAEVLERAVRQARSRANEQPVDQTKTIAKQILSAIFD
jgi:hypothetical protein